MSLQPTSPIRPDRRCDIFVFLAVAPLIPSRYRCNCVLLALMPCIGSCHVASELPASKTGRAVYGGHMRAT